MYFRRRYKRYQFVPARTRHIHRNTTITMNHVIIPFGVVVLAWILGAVILGIVGTTAAEALGQLMGMLLVFVKFLFALVTFGGGGFLLLVGAYRLIRVLVKRLHERIWPTIYLFWIAFGLFVFSYGFTMLFEKHLTRSVSYTIFLETPKWIFWTQTHSKTIQQEEHTGWFTASETLKTGGRWLLLFGAGALAIEYCVRRRRDIRTIASTTARKAHDTARRAKKALDGPT